MFEHVHLIEVSFIVGEGLLVSDLCNDEAFSNPCTLLGGWFAQWAGLFLKKDGSLLCDANH